MAILPFNLARVSNLQRSTLVGRSVADGQAKLLATQNELTTGRRLNAPSDDATDAAVAQQIRKQLETFESYKKNLQSANTQMAQVDGALGDVTDLLLRAKELASANVGGDVTPAEREGALAELDAIYRQILSTANTAHAGQYLFAGDRLNQPPFVEDGGGVKFVGNDVELRNRYDYNTLLAYGVSGANVFGGVSSRVSGEADLSPSLSAGTSLASLNGAGDSGIARGVIRIGNGSGFADVDLADADTVGDVITRINNAGLGGITASLGGSGIVISGGGGDNITVEDIGRNTVAADLGILTTTGGGAGVAITGSSLMPRVTPLTPVANLAGGGTIDLASGITITNGLRSATINFAGAATVEDILNAINDSDTGVRAQIAADGKGIEVLNPVQGSEMTLAENGGTTAADLGIRSFSSSSLLADMNFGDGVRLVDDVDLRLTDSLGASADLDLSAATSVQDVIDAINAAGVGITAGFATTGNGILLTDTALGGSSWGAANLNFSHAVQDLGLNEPASGGEILGRDVNAVRTEGVFTHLASLRKSLADGDTAGVNKAAEKLDADYDNVVRVRGGTGARLREFEGRLEQLADRTLTTIGLLSELEDTDYNEAILKFQTLQNQLQATYQTGSRLLNLSLMDFLG